MLVRHSIRVSDRHDIFFRDLGDRVALLLRLDCSKLDGAAPLNPCSPSAPRPAPAAEVLLVNTHLLFPHERYFDVIRMRELRKILGFIELYRLITTSHRYLSIPCSGFRVSGVGFQF